MLVASLDFEKPLLELDEKLKGLPLGSPEAQRVTQERQVLSESIFSGLGVWQKVQLSRHPDRPYTKDYLDAIFTDFVELHGDRAYAEDPAIISGFATFQYESKDQQVSRSVAVLGHQKGRSTKEKVKRNFGMAHPEGYRKAIRVMELANRFSLPVFTFIDTPGAYPGIGAEERGQSEAIGHSILVMSQLQVPVISIVIGEGGSGGALALGVADRVLMLEYSTYSVITPEGCASILWHDGAKAPQAAEQLKLLSADAARLGVIDEVIKEPNGGAHRNIPAMSASIQKALSKHLTELDAMPNRVELRYQKFRNMGVMQRPKV